MATPDLHKALKTLKQETSSSTEPPAKSSSSGGTTSDRGVAVAGYFDPEVRRQLKIMMAERDTTLQELLREAINDLFAKHGRPEIA